MDYILHIDTSTAVCSVCLSKNGELIDAIEDKQGMKHASHLTVFIDEILKKNSIEATDLVAVSINKGPGSYTGLRIGVSTAKGIAFGANIPVVTVSTLYSLFELCKSNKVDLIDEKTLFCPMIDARRMEVYNAVYDINGNSIQKIQATIVDENSFSDLLENNKIIFFGDGASKCKNTIKSTNAVFIDDILCSSIGSINKSYQKYKNQDFEDTAYFEPYYLKDFVTTVSKKDLLGRNK